MKTRPVVPRERAHKDTDEALTFYLSEAGAKVAMGFLDALEQEIGRASCRERV